MLVHPLHCQHILREALEKQLGGAHELEQSTYHITISSLPVFRNLNQTLYIMWIRPYFAC